VGIIRTAGCDGYAGNEQRDRTGDACKRKPCQMSAVNFKVACLHHRRMYLIVLRCYHFTNRNIERLLFRRDDGGGPGTLAPIGAAHAGIARVLKPGSRCRLRWPDVPWYSLALRGRKQAGPWVGVDTSAKALYKIPEVWITETCLGVLLCSVMLCLAPASRCRGQGEGSYHAKIAGDAASIRASPKPTTREAHVSDRPDSGTRRSNERGKYEP
jgi:hypothetical protein